MSRRRGAVEDCNKIPDVVANPGNIQTINTFVIQPQRQSQWCYASAIEAIAKYYGIYEHNKLNMVLNQENIAQWYLSNVAKGSKCNTDRKYGLNCPQDPKEILSTIFTVNTKYDSLDYLTLLKENPLIGLVDGHYIVLVGYDGTDIYYYDPIHGSDYSSVKNSGLRKINATCFLNKGIPIEYVDFSDNETKTTTSKLAGVYYLTEWKPPKNKKGGKRNTRRRSKKRAIKKTLRRR